MGNTNCHAFSSLQQDRVFRRLVLGHGRAGGQLQPAQPFDVHVALEAGEEQPDRVAVRRAHRLAVLVKAEQRVIHHFGERDAAAHAGGIGALGDHPARGRIDAGLVEQRREFDAGPFRTAEEAVNRGDAERLRLWGVECPAVAGALNEGDARLHRVAMQRLEREHKRAPDQPMDDEPVLVGIDVGDAGMAALEVQAAGRDHPVEQVQRRARRADTRQWRIGRRENGPHDLVLKARGLAVGGKARARLLHPALHNERLRRCARDADARCAGDDCAFEKDPTTEHPIAGCRLAERPRVTQTRSRFSHRQSPLCLSRKPGRRGRHGGVCDLARRGAT